MLEACTIDREDYNTELSAEVFSKHSLLENYKTLESTVLN